jgi:hypothetical protein
MLTPELLVLMQPGRHLAEWCPSELHDVVAPVLLPMDQPGSLEHLQVFRDCVQGDVKGLGDFRDPCRAAGEARENRPSSGMRNGVENGAQVVHGGYSTKRLNVLQAIPGDLHQRARPLTRTPSPMTMFGHERAPIQRR